MDRRSARTRSAMPASSTSCWTRACTCPRRSTRRCSCRSRTSSATSSARWSRRTRPSRRHGRCRGRRRNRYTGALTETRWLKGRPMLGDLVGTVRRNHALEHATIAVLLRRLGHDVRMVGRATRDGYYLYADVPTDLLEDSTREALHRMQAGEGHLAVSALCGTNLAVA